MSSQKSLKRPRDSEALDHMPQSVATTSQAGEELPRKRRRKNDATGVLAALESLAGQLALPSEQEQHLKRLIEQVGDHLNSRKAEVSHPHMLCHTHAESPFPCCSESGLF
jgi:hypothetical protein